MALSGSVSTGEMQGRSVTFSWTATQSITNNTSTISWKVTTTGSYAYGVAVRAVTAKINGSQVYHSDNYNGTYGGNVPSGVTIASGTKTITHNASGAGSFTAYIGAGIYYQWAINTENTKTFTLNTIARASSVSTTSYSLGSAGTITIAKPASSSFTHTLIYGFGNRNGTIATGLKGSAAITQSWTPPLELADQVPTATQGVGSITCQTYNGSTLIGSKSTTFTAYLSSSAYYPSLDSLKYELDNSANDVINGWGIAVAGYTKCKIIGTGSGVYGSTIKQFTITGGYNTTVNGSSLDYTGDTITTSGELSFGVRAVDSRSKQSPQTNFKINLQPYSTPTVTSFTAQRNLDKSTNVDIKGAWTYSSVNGKNAATATLKYRKSGDTMWTTYSGTITNDTTITLTNTFGSSDVYDFLFMVTDTVGNSATQTSTVFTEEALLDFKAGGTALGIGQLVPNKSDRVVHINPTWDMNIFDQSLKTMLADKASLSAETLAFAASALTANGYTILTAQNTPDYVIEYGDSATQGLDTSNFYADGHTHIYWQKWNSGKLEIYGMSHCTNNAYITNSSWGNGFSSNYFTLWGTWPVTFTSRPVFSVQMMDADSDTYIGDYMIIWNGPSSDKNILSQSPYFKFWRGTSKTFGHPKLSFTAIGRWK